MVEPHKRGRGGAKIHWTTKKKTLLFYDLWFKKKQIRTSWKTGKNNKNILLVLMHIDQQFETFPIVFCLTIKLEGGGVTYHLYGLDKFCWIDLN